MQNFYLLFLSQIFGGLFLQMFFVNLARAQDRAQIQEGTERLIYDDLSIDFARSPGVILGVIERDSTFIFSYGTVDKSSTRPPNTKDIFEIGSITNIFTARLINILAEKGILKKDISINNFLPDSLHNATAETITLENLLTHTAGLPRVPLGIGITQTEDNQPYAFFDKKTAGEYFRDLKIEQEKTGKYNFSHFGYALLEIIVENTTGKTFAEVMHTELLQEKYPHTFFDTKKIKQENFVQGYDKSQAPTPLQRYAAFSSAVGLKSNLTDLLTLLRENIDGADFDILQEAKYKTEMRKGVYAGEGWHLIKKKRKPTIYVHTGATSGYRAYMAFVKETRTGVVVLSNSEFALRGLGFYVLEGMN